MQISFLHQKPKEIKTHPAAYVGATHGERAENDFYPTPPGATLALLQAMKFPKCVWEPACGDGAISRVLESAGYQVSSYDLVERGFGVTGVDFFSQVSPPDNCTALITNPPYEVKTLRGKFAVEDWISHAWNMPQLDKMAMFLKTTALAGQRRSVVLEQSNLAWVLQFRGRVTMYANGVEVKGFTSMIDMAWYVFERGYADWPRVRWVDEVLQPAQMSFAGIAAPNNHFQPRAQAAHLKAQD